eukprot:scaffold179_cov368-Prasinococcus_capsulatus_cf.AAC.18
MGDGSSPPACRALPSIHPSIQAVLQPRPRSSPRQVHRSERGACRGWLQRRRLTKPHQPSGAHAGENTARGHGKLVAMVRKPNTHEGSECAQTAPSRQPGRRASVPARSGLQRASERPAQTGGWRLALVPIPTPACVTSPRGHGRRQVAAVDRARVRACAD